jgi:hypothetical protein
VKILNKVSSGLRRKAIGFTLLAAATASVSAAEPQGECGFMGSQHMFGTQAAPITHALSSLGTINFTTKTITSITMNVTVPTSFPANGQPTSRSQESDGTTKFTLSTGPISGTYLMNFEGSTSSAQAAVIMPVNDGRTIFFFLPSNSFTAVCQRL